MILDGESRREAIMDCLKERSTPINGMELAKKFGVSRQVIVQDIALLRARNRDILSTNKGYLLFHSQETTGGVTEVIMVRHTSEETLDEMCAIVDYGGSMLDVSIDHDLYGHIRADLFVHTLKDAEEFVEKMKNSTSKPLKELTEGCHYHTIQAPSAKAMSLIKKDLAEKGFLLN